MRKNIILKCKDILKYYLRCNGANTLLIDTPTHGNLGDHAIVLAEEQFINKHTSGKYAEITANEFDRCGKWLAKLTPRNRDILVPGGGFLGALWPAEEYRFRRILQAFSKQRVIVFPQTVTFDMDTAEGRAFFEESHKIYAAHKNLTIFVREQKSYNFMCKYMPEIHCELVPDIVTSYVPEFETSQLERQGALLCMRADCEKNLSDEVTAAIKEAVEKKLTGEMVAFTDTVVDHAVMPQDRAQEVENKLKQFSQAKLVVTDRLHGMVFAAIIGIPCIALGNSNGKVKGVYQWIRHCPYIMYANNLGEFYEKLSILKLNQVYYYDMKEMEPHFCKLAMLLKNRREKRLSE